MGHDMVAVVNFSKVDDRMRSDLSRSQIARHVVSTDHMQGQSAVQSSKIGEIECQGDENLVIGTLTCQLDLFRALHIKVSRQQSVISAVSVPTSLPFNRLEILLCEAFELDLGDLARMII